VELSENKLYREVIMEHYHHPQNTNLSDSLKKYSMKNPICGDNIIVQVEIKNDVILRIFQKSIGCALSTSSTSIMSEWLKGKTIKEAKYYIENYVKMVKGEPYDQTIDFQEAIIFEGVSSYPARFKCATISFEAVLKAIEEYENQKK